MKLEVGCRLVEKDVLCDDKAELRFGLRGALVRMESLIDEPEIIESTFFVRMGDSTTSVSFESVIFVENCGVSVKSLLTLCFEDRILVSVAARFHDWKS